MDRFQEMQVFAIVAQEQGFSAAARRLGLSAASSMSSPISTAISPWVTAST